MVVMGRWLLIATKLLTPNEKTPIMDPAAVATEQRRRAAAYALCSRAQDRTAWLMADRLCVAWELGGCVGVGVEQPTEGRR
jgi:hypothetical protein